MSSSASGPSFLAYIWTSHINPHEGDKAKLSEIWQRFPKFILGFVVTFLVGLALAVWSSPETLAKLTPAIAEANTFRVIFFTLTFFSIGVLSNFRKLWEDGLGKLAAVYLASLFGLVIWVGLDLLALFQRHQAAARRLTKRNSSCQKAISGPS